MSALHTNSWAAGSSRRFGTTDGALLLRLLIGNTTNRETIEQIAEGYRRLELVQDALEAPVHLVLREARDRRRGGRLQPRTQRVVVEETLDGGRQCAGIAGNHARPVAFVSG